MTMHHDHVAGLSHLWTAGAYFVIGSVLVAVAYKVWATHPINRVFLFGEYVTQKGLRLVLENWPFVFLFGLFILSCAIDHATEYAVNHYGLSLDFVRLAAVTEAVIATATAAAFVSCALRAIWKRRGSEGDE